MKNGLFIHSLLSAAGLTTEAAYDPTEWRGAAIELCELWGVDPDAELQFGVVSMPLQMQGLARRPAPERTFGPGAPTQAQPHRTDPPPTDPDAGAE